VHDGEPAVESGEARLHERNLKWVHSQINLYSWVAFLDHGVMTTRQQGEERTGCMMESRRLRAMMTGSMMACVFSQWETREW
jgi:hypothetical protein